MPCNRDPSLPRSPSDAASNPESRQYSVKEEEINEVGHQSGLDREGSVGFGGKDKDGFSGLGL